jgi:uncharacterized membrane protein YuzA (DUF378 family)
MLRILSLVAGVLTLIGALNWGLIGLFRFNLVQALLGPLARLIYVVVGVSSLLFGFSLFQTNQNIIKR